MMRLVAFLQLRNELENGNLIRCLENCKKWADDIYIYDDCSDDGSQEIYQKYTTTRLKRWPEYRAQYKKLIDQGIVIPNRYLKKYKLMDYKGDNIPKENLNAPEGEIMANNIP